MAVNSTQRTSFIAESMKNVCSDGIVTMTECGMLRSTRGRAEDGSVPNLALVGRIR
jgi:hypothetical protein